MDQHRGRNGVLAPQRSPKEQGDHELAKPIVGAGLAVAWTTALIQLPSRSRIQYRIQ